MTSKTPNTPSLGKPIPPSEAPRIPREYRTSVRDEMMFQELRLRAAKEELRPQVAVRLLKVATCSHPVQVTIVSLARTQFWSVMRSMPQVSQNTHTDPRIPFGRPVIQNAIFRDWMKSSLGPTNRLKWKMAELRMSTPLYRAEIYGKITRMKRNVGTELVRLLLGVGLIGNRLVPLQRKPLVRLVSASLLIVCALRTALHGGRVLEP